MKSAMPIPASDPKAHGDSQPGDKTPDHQEGGWVLPGDLSHLETDEQRATVKALLREDTGAFA